MTRRRLALSAAASSSDGPEGTRLAPGGPILRPEKEGNVLIDEDTIRWLRQEAEEDGDQVVVRACSRAAEGDPIAIATLEETLQTRVARAHQRHRKLGYSPAAD